MLHVIAKFIAITKEEGMEEEKKKVVFWSTKSLAKKVSFFVPYVNVCFHPIAANGLDVIHGCGGQEGGQLRQGHQRKTIISCQYVLMWRCEGDCGSVMCVWRTTRTRRGRKRRR